jgi:hypothetical protein
MDLLKILLPVAGIYVAFLIIWWLVCAIASKNAIRSQSRAHFDVVEIIDIGLMRFWRFVSYCVLAAFILWLILIGRWYFGVLAIFWFAKIWWFGSIFYLPFNIIESRYMARVAMVFGAKHAIKASKDKQKQVQQMKDRGWTVPDGMK